MTTQVEVHFHGIEKSEAVEQRVREKVAKLKKHFTQMTSCRVAVEVPQRTADRPKVYQIKIEIGVPRRAPVIVSHERTGSHASEDLPLAIREAFEAASAQGGRNVSQDRPAQQDRAGPAPTEPSQRSGVIAQSDQLRGAVLSGVRPGRGSGMPTISGSTRGQVKSSARPGLGGRRSPLIQT